MQGDDALVAVHVRRRLTEAPRVSHNARVRGLRRGWALRALADAGAMQMRAEPAISHPAAGGWEQWRLPGSGLGDVFIPLHDERVLMNVRRRFAAVRSDRHLSK